MGELLRTGARRVRPAVRPPVLARVGRLPGNPGRLHARPRHRLLRELAARGVRAARVRRREPGDVAGEWRTGPGGSRRGPPRPDPPPRPRAHPRPPPPPGA